MYIQCYNFDNYTYIYIIFTIKKKKKKIRKVNHYNHLLLLLLLDFFLSNYHPSPFFDVGTTII